MVHEHSCEYPSCGVTLSASSEAFLIEKMKIHQSAAHGSVSKAPRIDRPKVSRGISAEEFANWEKRYELWKSASSVKDDPSQLIACCDMELESALISYYSDIAEQPEAEVLKRIKQLAVLDVASTVKVTELLNLKQQHGESARSYTARLRGKAQTCAFNITCSKDGCEQVTSYTDNIVRYVLLAGLASNDIARDVLGTTDIDNKNLDETLTLIESRERAMRATATETQMPNVAAISSYKKLNPKGGNPSPSPSNETIMCASCQVSTPKYGKNRWGKVREFKFCTDCFKRKKNNTSMKKDGAAAVFEALESIEPIGVLSDDQNSSPCGNYLYDKNIGWYVGNSKPQPTITLKASIDHKAYHAIHKIAPVAQPVEMKCISDSGCMSALAPITVLQKMGLSEKNLLPVKKRMKTAAEGEIHISGAIFLQLSGTDSEGKTHSARSMVYISPEVTAFYLSRHCMEQLKIIPESFPQVGSAASAADSQCDAARSSCGCLTRTATPGRPSKLPFEATAENTGKMREWLLKTYSSSTFNKCTHQALPTMTGPELKVTIEESATPFVTKRSPTTPIHWREAVKQQLDEDVALGVIEKVPPGTPTTWLHHMVIRPKDNGKPRRTIDTQPLNKVTKRETHHVIPPAKQVRAIPKGQIMTVCDAWNGYHSIPIAEEDRHKFTFATEYGRYRYCRAPQGFSGSGDAYTHRYDLIVSHVERLLKVIDDTLLYDDKSDMETHWWRVIDYLELCGSNGIILNSEGNKFQFSSPEVEFTSFKISESSVTPLHKYVQAIKDFPRPSNLTDVRAWFGLVNQVAHYGRMVELMAPFKPLLSPKTKFVWTDELENAFVKSKAAIIDAIIEGVEIFDPNRTTCLQTDYSGAGIGYWLRQKHCECSENRPDCCDDGWKITLVGSRFLRDAEKNYVAIEGECLAVAWSLEDTSWFTLGCSSLIVATDHKPLLNILNDKSLEAIRNPRLFRLKQRTLFWRFTILHVPGRWNCAADATSRNPADQGQVVNDADTLAAVRIVDDDTECMEADIVATFQSHVDSYGAVTWHDLQRAQQTDEELKLLHRAVSEGFPDDRAHMPDPIKEYWPYKDRLYAVDGVIMMDSRVVIPSEFRSHILDTLHAAHQGTSGMQSRARDTVFWPGIHTDINRIRNACHICTTMAPSQPHMPPVMPIIPEFPFQAIVGDYFELSGNKYLVVVDRFSGWPHVVRAKFSSEAAGARGLIRVLRHIFGTFGVPEEFTSDGGPEFTADETVAFFKRWGVTHIIASAYNPESNGRAEVGVKSMKRLLTGNVNPDGSLDTDRVITSLLQYRNTPDPSTGMSPAMILFGRKIRDKIPIPPGTSWFENPQVSPVWQRTWRAREDALRIRYAKQIDKLQAHTRDLGILPVSADVSMQNLCGNHPTKWDRSGRVIEHLPHDQYLVRMHGSGRIVRRNRRHLRQIVTLRAPALSLPFPQAHQIAMPAQPHLNPLQGSPSQGSVVPTALTSQPLPHSSGIEPLSPRLPPLQGTISPDNIGDPSSVIPDRQPYPATTEMQLTDMQSVEPSEPPLDNGSSSSPSIVLDDVPATPPSRPSRIRRKPAYLKDYVP